jgi:hypothetical protein
MSLEQFEEAQRLFEVTQQATIDEQWRMCCLLARKKDGELLGQTEFELREHVMRMGARALEAAVNERRQKGATTVVASLAPASTATNTATASAATTTPASSSGGRKRS